MASIQSFKKNLKVLTQELFFDCYVTEMFCEPAKKSEILKVAKKIEEMRKHSLHQIYFYRKQTFTGKENKKFFNDLKNQIAKSTQEIIEMLEKLESKE